MYLIKCNQVYEIECSELRDEFRLKLYLENVYHFGQNLAHYDFSEGQILAILLWCLIQEVHWCITKK